jgi:hypothetical protein
MRKNKSEIGSAHVIVLSVLVVVLIAVLGFLFWNNFVKKDTPAPKKETASKVTEFCADGQDTTAKNGTFCSTDVGIKFTVPSIFAGKLAKADNYEVFQGPLDPNTKTSAGSSENIYKATISGNDNFMFTIAQEPLRTGYVDVTHALQNTYFDQATGELTLINMPTVHYDSVTNTSTKSGGYSKGDAVPSSTVDGVQFFKGSYGDAGQIGETYFGVVNNKIVKISLKYMGYMGDPSKDPSTIDSTKVFDEFANNMKGLTIAKK